MGLRMMMSYWPLAIFAGACIAIQAAMNARLGQLLNNAWLATGYAFLTSFLLVLVFFLFAHHKQLIAHWQMISVSHVPWYLWLSSVLSVIGVGSMYWLIPKMGVGNLMSYALTGQIIIAMLISHYGFFNSAQRVLTSSKLLGCVLLVIGIILINRK